MALGRQKKERQQDFWIATADLPRSEGHVFYRKLNQLLRDAGFDPFVETLCEPYYHDTWGRPGIPLTADTPDHSSLTRVRDRLPLEVHAAVFQFVLQVAETKGLLKKGKTIAVDATTLEANAADSEEQRQAVANNRRRTGGPNEAAPCSGNEARRWNGASPTYAKRAEVVARGCWESTRCENAT